MTQSSTLVVATYNIGGARRKYESNSGLIRQVVEAIAPDILAVQEAVRYRDRDGNTWSAIDDLKSGLLEATTFSPNLSLSKHYHPNKSRFVEAKSKGYEEWEQGLGLLCRGFVSSGLSDNGLATVPIFTPPEYEGDRDTEPRIVLLAHCDIAPLKPWVAAVHFSTLLGERASDLNGLDAKVKAKTHAIAEKSVSIRSEQARKLLAIIRERIGYGAPMIVLGDFNAESNEPCIAEVLEKEGGLIRLEPSNPKPTHPKAASPIDHIFVGPEWRLASYKCHIVDSDAAARASDHLPVVARITFD